MSDEDRVPAEPVAEPPGAGAPAEPGPAAAPPGILIAGLGFALAGLAALALGQVEAALCLVLATLYHAAQAADVLKKVLADGIPDEHMAGVIQREFLDRGEKALVYCSLQHAFTRYRSTEYAKTMREKGFAETRRAGTILDNSSSWDQLYEQVDRFWRSLSE